MITVYNNICLKCVRGKHKVCDRWILQCLKCAREQYKSMKEGKDQDRYNQSMKEGKDQESIQSSTTPDPGCQWESSNFSIDAKTSALSLQVTTRHL